MAEESETTYTGDGTINTIDNVVNNNPVSTNDLKKSRKNNLFRRIKFLASASLLALTMNLYSQKNTSDSTYVVSSMLDIHQVSRAEYERGDFRTRAPLYIGSKDFGIRPVLQFEFLGLKIIRNFQNNISNIPEEYRFVPIHPDDAFIDPSQNGVISISSNHKLSDQDYAINSLTPGLALNIKNLEVQFDARFNFELFNTPDLVTLGDNQVFRSYYLDLNAVDNVGRNTDLKTYYQLKYSMINPDLSIELSLPIRLEALNKAVNKYRIVLGACERKFKTEIETGWHRRDIERDIISREKYKTYYLTDLVEKSIYTGLEIRCPLNEFSPITLKFLAGYNFYSLDNSKSAYKSMTPSDKHSLFVQFMTELRF